MEEGNDKGNFRDEIYSKAVRAGKRTYFFDVKSTRGGDLYLTITESKKRFHPDGKFYFEKHKLFLYKEDFDKFSDGLIEVVDKIEELKGNNFDSKPEVTEEIAPEVENEVSSETESSLTDENNDEENADGNEFKEVDFDDLGK